MIFKAVGDSVLLKEVNLEETTDAGIIIKSKDFHPIYEVICIGDKVKITDEEGNVPIKVGDYIMIPKTVGNNVTYNGITYRYCKSWEILCIIEP